MQSSLWKLGALLGVIGVGFLVLLKAQNDMTGHAPAPEEFNELAALDELSDLNEEPAAEPEGRVALADTYSDEPTPTAAQPPEDIEPTPAAEPTPAPLRSRTAVSAAAGPAVETPESNANPFEAFGFDEPAGSALAEAPSEQSEPEEAVATDDAAAGAVNPFTGLVRSLTDKAADKLADVEATVQTEVAELPDKAAEIEAEAAEQTDDLATHLGAAAEKFDPFAPVADTSAEPTQAPQETDAEPTGAEPTEDPALAAVEPTDEPETSFPESPFDPEVISVPAPKQYEPTSLTALPPTGAGPALIGPPAQDDEPGLPQQAEPAAFETSDTDPQNAIAQVSGERQGGGASDPNPFMVFPGDPEPEPAPLRDAPAGNDPAPQPQFPSVEPRQSAGRAWVGDESPQIESNDRVVLPDGTVEMTIQPRGQAAPSNEFNPFATVPERNTQPQQLDREFNAQSEPAPFDVGQTSPSRDTQQQYSDPGLSFSKGPIQPSGAERPAGANNNPLTPADFVGVGTISPDTPSTPQQAQLTIEKHAPPDASLGQELIYSIVIKNVGQSTARNVIVEDIVPKGSDLLGTIPQAQMANKKLVWQLGAIDPRQSRTIQIKIVPTEPGQIGSVATVSFEAAVASRTVITAPDVRLDMNGPQEVRVGEKASRSSSASPTTAAPTRPTSSCAISCPPASSIRRPNVSRAVRSTSSTKSACSPAVSPARSN